MENNKDLDYIKAQLDSIPSTITLPSSLSAESLWAKVDAGELTAEETPSKKQGKVVELVRRFRPVLSYAAVFVVMVAVYYSVGLDSTSEGMQMQLDSSAPAAAAPMPMMESPAMADDAPPLAGHAAPRMAIINEDTADAKQQSDTEAGQANPDTSTMGGGSDDSMLSENSYAIALDNAVAMERHLISVLSPKDYGGIYVGQGDEVKLHIWVVNQDAVDTAVQAYPDTQCNIVMETAKCSLEDLKVFAGVLERIKLRDGETLNAFVSDEYNSVAVNISKSGETRLKDEIAALVLSNGIPKESVNIFTLDPDGINPVT